MKRQITILIAILMMVFTACSASEGGQSRPDGAQTGESFRSSPRAEAAQPGASAHSRPDGSQAGQKAERRVRDSGGPENARQAAKGGRSVTGTVKAMVGNEATLTVTAADGTETTERYLLPVGMSIGSRDFSSVSAGNTLTITFGAHPGDGSEIITSVTVGASR